MSKNSATLIAILAAGRSSRFGGDKLLSNCAGKPLGQWALDVALLLELPVIWVGCGPSIGIAAEKCPVILNENPDQGQSESVRASIKHAMDHKAESLMVLLADMPLVTPELLRQLLSLTAPAACLYDQGTPGVPAIIPASEFPALDAIKGDHGAGRYLRERTTLSTLSVSRELLLDVDTPEDLDHVHNILLHRQSVDNPSRYADE